MPASYKIDTDQRLVRMRASGMLTSGELRDYYYRLTADARFDSSFRSLALMGDVTEFEVEAREIAELAALPVFDRGTRRAIAALSDLAYGLARMFSLYAENVGQNIRVFRTEIEAMVWLDSPVEPGREPDFQATTPPLHVRVA